MLTPTPFSAAKAHRKEECDCTRTMGRYSDSENWRDVVPIPQDDGGPNPLAAIAYTEDYSEAMSYLRAVMAENEKSERVLSLTEDVISMNPAHYTVWYVSRIDLDARPELIPGIQALQSGCFLCPGERSFAGAGLAQQSLSEISEELPNMVQISFAQIMLGRNADSRL